MPCRRSSGEEATPEGGVRLPSERAPGAIRGLLFSERGNEVRRYGFLASLASLAAAASLALAACGQTTQAQGPIHLTDDAGTHIVLKQPVNRIISLGPSNTEILLALGLKKDIVGIDNESVQYSPAPYQSEAKGLTEVGDSYTCLDMEKVIAIKPQLILAIPGAANLGQFKSLKLRYAMMNPTSVQGIYKDIRFIGAATGHGSRAAALIAKMKSQLTAIHKAVASLPKPSIYVELDPKQFYTAGPGSFLDGLVTMAGGRNIADKITHLAYPALSAESIIVANPQAIVLLDVPYTSVKAVDSRPGWSQISAVKSGRVYGNIDPSLLSEPSPVIVQGVRELARDLHPGVKIP